MKPRVQGKCNRYSPFSSEVSKEVSVFVLSPYLGRGSSEQNLCPTVGGIGWTTGALGHLVASVSVGSQELKQTEEGSVKACEVNMCQTTCGNRKYIPIVNIATGTHSGLSWRSLWSLEGVLFSHRAHQVIIISINICFCFFCCCFPTVEFLGHVGAPLPCNLIKLVDVPEKNYYASRGEGEVGVIRKSLKSRMLRSLSQFVSHHSLP